MDCPKCGKKTRVIDTVPVNFIARLRKRLCTNHECQYFFFTEETVIDNKQFKPDLQNEAAF